MKRIAFQEAYVLHRRPYRETSFLVDVITNQYGRLTLVAKGSRQGRSATQGLVQPFIPLLISWSGQGELVTMTDIEAHGEAKRLTGDSLFSGFYLNELLMLLLEQWDPHPALFRAYSHAIRMLSLTSMDDKLHDERTLRSFEKFLLEELGYGVLPGQDVSLIERLQPNLNYRFIPDHGWVQDDVATTSVHAGPVFSGKSLLSIAREEWENEDVLREAKRLTRFILAPLLGARTLNSRRLFTLPEGEKA